MLSGSEAAAVACKEPGQWRRAMELLEISVWQRLVPNEILYEVAITSSQQANYLRPSILLLESLSARTASSMLPAKGVKCAVNGSWEFSLQILSAQVHARLLLEWPVLNAAVSACSSGRSWRHPLELLSRSLSERGGMESNENRQAQPGIAATLLVLVEEQQWESALLLVEPLASRSIEIDMVSCGPLLTYCEQEGLLGQEAGLLLAFKGLGLDAQTKLALQLQAGLGEGKEVCMESQSVHCFEHFKFSDGQ
eukprot:s552_g12.t1